MTQKYQVKVSMKQAAIVETGIVLKQGDFGMQIEIEVLDFDATGTTPQIVFRKAMGAVESTTITVSGNKYTYTFKGTELDTPGKCFCDLKLKNSTTQRISTASFSFKVVADTLDGLAEESSSYSDTVEQIVNGYEESLNDVMIAVYNKIFTHPSGTYSRPDTAWFGYPNFLLSSTNIYRLTFNKNNNYSGAYIALVDSNNNQVSAVYEVIPSESMIIKPETDSYILAWTLPLCNTGVSGSQPIIKKYNSTAMLQIGDTITFDPSWEYDSFGFEFEIEEATDSAQTKNEIQALNEKIDGLSNYPIFEAPDARNINSGAWFSYANTILYSGTKYQISFNKAISYSGAIAICNLEMKVIAVYDITQNTTINITPAENCFIMFFGIPYANGSDYPTTKIYRSTNMLVVGDTVTFDPSWEYNSFGFGINIYSVYGSNDITKLFNRFIVVAKDGTGDYESLVEAVENNPSGATIFVKPGIYDGSVRAFHKRINIIGTDRNKCIIRNTDGRYINPPLECCCGYVENLTFYAQYIEGTSQEIGPNSTGAYAVHCENDQETLAEGDSMTFVNCNFMSDFFPALGCGSFKNWKLQLLNCRLTSNQEDRAGYISYGTLGALYIHDMNGAKGTAYIYIQDCIIENKSHANTMCLFDQNQAGAALIFEFVNNTLFSITNKFTDSIWWRGIETPFSNHFTLSEISHGNTGSVLNN